MNGCGFTSGSQRLPWWCVCYALGSWQVKAWALGIVRHDVVQYQGEVDSMSISFVWLYRGS